MAIGIADALVSLRPGATWTCGSTYESIEWHDTVQSIPTAEEVATEVARLQAEYEFKEYQRLREKAYPRIEEQLDILYHQGIEGWKAVIDQIKLQYPKPE